MTRTLDAHAAALGLTLAGSVIARPPADRIDLARSLTATGHWVHADRIEGSYRGQAGVSFHEVHDLAAVPGIRLDVHLMVDDPAAELTGLPRRGLSRITLQCEDLHDLAPLVRRSRTYADEVWLAVHHGPVDASRLEQSGADGVLVLLTPPGQPGHRADLGRLPLVAATCAHGLPAGA
ncbi:MAG: hypothetical protein WB798_03365, partial [Nocardioidaceae bacterium]